MPAGADFQDCPAGSRLNARLRAWLPRILRNIDGFNLRVVEESFLAVDAAAGAARDSLAAVREAVGNRIVAVDLARSIAELLGQRDAPFDILRPDARAQPIRRTVRQLQNFLGRRSPARCRLRMEDPDWV